VFSTLLKDEHTSMFTVHTTNRFTLIDVKEILRGVHLMPKFGSSFTATGAHKTIGIDGDTFTQFEDYWLNSFIDIHVYNLVG